MKGIKLKKEEQMLSDFLTNRWIIGGVVYLMIFTGGCFLWYRYDTSYERRQAQETALFVTKSQRSIKQGNPILTTSTDIPLNRSKTLDEETLLNQVVEDSNIQEIIASKEDRITIMGREIKISDIPDIPKESLHGFGIFPEIPEDYPWSAIWLAINYYDLPSEKQRQHELLDRVLIKLWTDGEKDFKGGKIDGNTGLVYPNYSDTVYITIEERVLPDGSIKPIITRQFGSVSQEIDLLNQPKNINVLDYDSGGIDPYEYLNLQ